MSFLDKVRSVREAFVFDIDGTLADHRHIRSPFDESRVLLDKPILPVFKVLEVLAFHYKIIFVSGRTDSCYNDTVSWILKYYNPYEKGVHIPILDLRMRKTGDSRPDDIVKKEIYDEHILPYYTIVGVFDDRLKVCRMLYENNIFCFNVNQGLKEF